MIHRSQILAFSDSSSALGWMHKSSFDAVNKGGRYTVDQWLCWTLFRYEVSLKFQHIKVTNNIIVELLSSDFHISDQSLT